MNIFLYTCATPINGIVAVIGLFEGWLQFLLPLVKQPSPDYGVFGIKLRTLLARSALKCFYPINCLTCVWSQYFRRRRSCKLIMSSNIIGPSPNKLVAPSEKLEKASGDLYDIKAPVVMICLKYLGNKNEDKKDK